LFQRNISVISRHIHNIFAEDELKRVSVVANCATTADGGKSYQIEHFNLDRFNSSNARQGTST